MPKKKPKKIDINKDTEHNIDDIVLEEDFVSISDNISDKISKIQKKLKECKKGRQEYLDGWQRARASSINREKEIILERERAISRAEDEVFIKLFPILDSFDMAFSNKKLWEGVDKDWRVGIENIYSQVNNIFNQASISVIDTDCEFDPYMHEPVKVEEVDSEEKDNHILTVVQKGYQKDGHILRPAKVIIGKFK